MQITHSESKLTSNSQDPYFLLLHGWGSNEHDLPGLVHVIDESKDFVAVRAPISLIPSGYAWFDDPVVKRNEREELAENAGNALINWLNEQDAEGVLPKERPIILLGFSQGASMVSHLILRNEFSGENAVWNVKCAIMLSGYLPFDESQKVASDIKIPVFHGWGDADDIVPLNEHERVTKFFTGHVSQLTEKMYPDLMHSINLAEVQDIQEFLAADVNN